MTSSRRAQSDDGTAQRSLLRLIDSIVSGDTASASAQLVALPELATVAALQGASRQTAIDYFFDDIRHYLYAGDTALHIAVAAYRTDIAQTLITAGADVGAKNRRGAEPLHYAVDGGPGSPTWDPEAQVATINCLIAAGADLDAIDRGGVTPLHRAVRNRCAAAVAALLEAGADPLRTNKNGSTPMALATQNTGRGGTGSPEAKAQQQQIVQLLEARMT